MCIHFVAYRTSTTADFNVWSDGSKKFVVRSMVIKPTFLHMIVVALSCGAIMEWHNPVSFIKAIRNLLFYISSDGLQLSLICFLVTYNAY
jgi:hypothetical protein